MADPNRALFESVVRLLAPVLDELVFVGGCTTGLFITHPAASGIRPTRGVDAIVDVASYAKYTALSERLRTLGLAEDATPGAPLCRWRRDDLIVDVMPVNEDILGFSNRWYPIAIETAHTFDIAGHATRVGHAGLVHRDQHRHLRNRRVLCQDNGTPITRQGAWSRVRCAAKRAKVPTGVHILRHTFCSHLAMEGAPMRGVQELVGHQSLAMTQRYSHLTPASLDSTIRLLDSRRRVGTSWAPTTE